MQTFRKILFTAISLICSLTISAQQNYATKIVGIWSAPYKNAGAQGSLMLKFDSNHNVEITRSITIEGVAHAAFIQRSGTWSLNGNYITITPGQQGPLRWTREIANQISSGEIDSYEASTLLNTAKQKIPGLNALHFATRMQIRQITESKLILLNPKDSQTLSFSRLSSYPAGRRLNISNADTSFPEEEIKTEDDLRGISVSNEGTDDVTVGRRIYNEVIVEEKKPEQIFTAVEESPKFPGGDAEMYKFLSMNIRYPEMAAQNNIQGRVTVQFVVEKD
ncbi:MAG: energy transducer TonB, partial [Muribaculaceae bacterium]|nr:energy transducer TonB [Muribaculaceae bacterium]